MMTKDARAYIRDLIAMNIVREMEDDDEWPFAIKPVLMQEVLGVVRCASLRIFSLQTDVCLVSRGLAQWFHSRYVDVFFDAYTVHNLHLAVMPPRIGSKRGGGIILVVDCEDLDTFTKKRFLLAPSVPHLYELPTIPEEEDDEE